MADQHIIFNKENIAQLIDNCINDYCNIYGLDIYNYNFRVNIKHNEVNNILFYCYKNLFASDVKQWQNKKSLIDYDDIELLNVIAYKFIDICLFFNKSLGLMSFCLFTGIDDNTIQRWKSPEGKTLNPAKWELCKAIQENNKNLLVSHLKDSTIGAVAVANNDYETGLNWSKNNVQSITQNAVYILPSERLQQLKLDKQSDAGTVNKV